MEKVKFNVLLHLRENASLSRPAWTSTEGTGMFRAHRHKHTMDRGKFRLFVNHFHNRSA
jgi:hypothetical protein